jgi:hypothetical protein
MTPPKQQVTVTVWPSAVIGLTLPVAASDAKTPKAK